MEADVELRQLRYFVTVAEELHFGRAAERLHIVQPAVSQQVRRLERELGVPLLDRSPRRVRLTSAGERLLPEARAVLAAADRTASVAAELARAGAVRLRIGTAPGLGPRLEPALAELRRAAPGLEVELDYRPPHERLTAVRDGDLDLALVRALPASAAGPRPPGLQVTELWREPLMVALPAAHPLAGAAAVRPADLAGLPARLPGRDCDRFVHDLIVRACREAGVEPLLGRPAGAPHETLLEIGGGPPAWTVLYPADVPPATRTVSVLPFDPEVLVPGFLVTSGMSASCAGTLLAAFG
ncbi:LysR family transcriptional regulator [Microtetraspora sp. NBRC 13810]|uniref:LysR family transcriptional regulator n=1 Tax=Microtetraspora sp. NBRC 13810 TaxID=3030990 RepID=UPI0025554327|nr:LysR family transcriptional regulator [Microtetraspora sp. NBRC 13810]